MTSKLSAKFLEMFKNIKSDAVPRPPRESESLPGPRISQPETDEHLDESNNQEDVFVEQEEVKKKKKPKFKKFFSAPSGENHGTDENERRSCDANSNVNTQASGNVINIINSSRVRCGNEIVYYMGPVQNQQHRAKTSTSDDDDDEEVVEKTNLIVLLMETDIEPEHEYIDYISKHLGKKWHCFFRKLGYKQGQIETAEIDMAKHGVSEARYKLLLDWIRNDDEGTLGKLAKVLWEGGERQIVKELAAMYNKSK